MGTNKFRVIPKNHLSTVGYDAKSACSGWKFRLTDGSIKNGEFELRLYGTKAYLLEDWKQFVEIPWVKVILYEV